MKTKIAASGSSSSPPGPVMLTDARWLSPCVEVTEVSYRTSMLAQAAIWSIRYWLIPVSAGVRTMRTTRFAKRDR